MYGERQRHGVFVGVVMWRRLERYMVGEGQPARAREQLGRVIVAQSVLASVVEMTALTVPGVVRLVPRGPFLGRAGRAGGHMVTIAVEGNAVRADLGIVVAVGTDVATIGAAVRQQAAAAIERLLGMEAKAVNVVVWDVENAPTHAPDPHVPTATTGEDGT